MKTKISDFFFYKHRYVITYLVLSISYLAIIFYTLFIAPNGLTNQEIKSTTSAANLELSNIFSAQIIDLPYKIIQKISIWLFGLSNFSIKLPSILLSFATLLLLIKLTRAWFGKGISNLALIIAITSSQFFFLAQNGTSEILHILYPALLTLIGINFIKRRRTRYIIFGSIVISLSVYTPLIAYTLLAFGLTIIAHPHLRFNLRKGRKRIKFAGWLLSTVLLIPLIFAVIRDISILKTLFGIPDSLNLLANFNQFISSMIGFSSAGNLGIVSPIINFASAILVSIGLYFILSARHSSRSYLINILAIIGILVCLISPHASSILFIPILVLTITGLKGLIQTWYTIFPQNPYARIIGLVPIVVFVSSLILTNLNNFRQNYAYSPEVISNFSQDLKIINENINQDSIILTSDQEVDFYKILERKSKAKITTKYSGSKIIATKMAIEQKSLPKNYKIEKVIVSDRTENSDRFYILAKIAQ